MIDKNHKTESLIAGSVRARILECLWDATEEAVRFKDIKTEIKNNRDNVVKRELDILIERGWVERMGRGLYRINKDVKGLSYLMNKLKAMPDPDAEYYPFEVDTTILKDAIEELKDDSNEMDISRAIPNFSMIVAGKKIEGFDPSFFADFVEDIAPFYDFMYKMALYRAILTAESDQQNTSSGDENTTGDDIKKHLDDIFYNQDFKLIVSWSPAKK